MSINKDIKISAMPLALGVVLSTTIALQPAALPVLAQETDSEIVPVQPQMGGVMAFGAGDMEPPPGFAAVLTPALGEGPMEAFHMGGEGGEGHDHHGFSDANKMTDDQYERMYAIRSEMHDQMGLKMAQMHILHHKLRDCLAAANIDTKQAQDLARQITSMKADMTQMKLDSMIKMAQVLTPEQRKELHLMMIKPHHHHFGHHHMWGHHGHGMEHHEGPSHEHHEEMGK